MWIAKKGDERKKEFLETAVEIFKTKGYGKTSINDILKQMNITKGAFYYYFESKEALLHEIVNQLTEKMQTVVKDIANRNDLSAVSKLEHIFNATHQLREENQSAYYPLYALQKRDENAFIARKFMQKSLSINKQFIELIITQGIQEGSFKTSNATETAELYIRLTSLCKEKIADIISDSSYLSGHKTLYKKAEDLITFYQEALERILGAEKGTLNFLNKTKEYISGMIS
ncbi:TetR/AcrR family transcriptional regulator [Clostridium sp. D2Q-11]|uniref:TetR/AcrR family transcriptional regulator n=1 Tax=Anaeromonas frigoriresistens TaxID=2683708 RepID=A0A942Z9D1_9FIRM|nr:TetR/AcrR family transcriptional regulator [Anaeromonas frigoriresistens]MBS4539198.1 TetR/AcrR family transcriptional regulator [Anaeromonas frigoriresistens]